MKENQNILGCIIGCIFEVIAGILLLLNPIGFAKGIVFSFGIIMILVGLVCTIKYFISDAVIAAAGQFLTIGLFALCAGIFFVIKFDGIIKLFPVITIVYGIIIFVSGLSKIQLTLDMARAKSKTWFLPLLGAILSIVCAVIILNNVIISTAALWIFTGAVLIASAIVDLLTAIFFKKALKKAASDNNIVE